MSSIKDKQFEIRYLHERIKHQEGKINKWLALDEENKNLAYNAPEQGKWPINWGSPDTLKYTLEDLEKRLSYARRDVAKLNY